MRNLIKDFKKDASYAEFKDLVYSILRSSDLNEWEEYITKHPDMPWASSAKIILSELTGVNAWKAFTVLIDRLYGKPTTSVEAQVEQTVSFTLKNLDE